MRAWQREECNSVSEPVWTLRRQHIPGVGQWEAHSVHSVVLPAELAGLKPGLRAAGNKTNATQMQENLAKWAQILKVSVTCASYSRPAWVGQSIKPCCLCKKGELKARDKT